MFCFHPLNLWEMIKIRLVHIFQLGWFNHHLPSSNHWFPLRRPATKTQDPGVALTSHEPWELRSLVPTASSLAQLCKSGNSVFLGLGGVGFGGSKTSDYRY